MGWWPFGRKKADDKSVETLLAEANAASPTGHPAADLAADPAADPAPDAQPGDGWFRLPVEDVFMITGRGVVVTGRVESGTGTVGMQVQVVRDGSVVATTAISAIEKFREVIDVAQPGENVGLLLRGLARDQLQSGDLIQG